MSISDATGAQEDADVAADNSDRRRRSASAKKPAKPHDIDAAQPEADQATQGTAEKNQPLPRQSPKETAQEKPLENAKPAAEPQLPRTFRRGRLGLVGLLIAAGVILFLVRPWEGALPPQKDVASLWSESISRLGIEPLFPPQEDFHVGDVLAVIAAYDDNGQLRGAAPDLPLLRKSIRIAHIDLRAISGRNVDAPLFAETKLDGNSKVLLHQQRTEVEQDTGPPRLPLDLVSFPSLTIVNDDRVGAGDDSWISFAAQRQLQTEEHVTINSAETYGARGPAAVAMLTSWCLEPQNALYCTDALPRRILNFTTDPDVLRTRDDKYVYRIEIKLITRVYMTREIDFSRSANGSVDTTLGQVQAEAPKEAAGAPRPSAPTGDESAAAEAPAMKPTTMQLGRRAEMSLGMGRVVFARPVVFGFNAVTFALEPSLPAPTSHPTSSPRGKPIR